MRLTKLEHSCVLLELGTHRLYVDPGKFTTPLTECANVDAVIITHEHDDHWTPEQLGRIAARSPGVRVLTTARTAELIRAANVPELGEVTIGRPGELVRLGEFAVTCFGGAHAEIHSSIPRIDNLGFVVNGIVGYGGDSYELPPDAFDLTALAVPTYGPWMRIAESMDFIEAVRPKAVFGVHEMLLARAGKELAAARLRDAVEAYGGTFLALGPYDSVELDKL